MSLIDLVLYGVVLVSGFLHSPFVLVIFAGLGAYLGKVAVETIPFTRRIIERREAAAREGSR
ncbi:hypothetical protein Misp01_06320 [Microtetraspora sp. NBRC 13810]|uniref:hypothetical protein n=1 Tax=Microtetraspora sp. NBRC 13810 TaxID=3030990 RepID=UPI0024A2D13A|nr:hypothetical protein [Microtetraspora sp. NBRC 13810]GLW05502.1 hypothetical protein Misp01_06320 [Microtetraspora sp. NBRC 13810]